MSPTLAKPTRRQFIRAAGALTVVGLVGGAVVELTGVAANASTLPDLIITSLIIPAGMTAGQTVNFGVNIKNQGSSQTPANVEIGVGFWVDGLYIGWSSKDHQALAAGATSVLHADSGGVNGTGGWIATTGTHTLKAYVNDADRFPEASRTNNILTGTFTVGGSTTPPTTPPTTTPVGPAAAPVNTQLPTISGTATVGSILSASTGTWS